MNRGAVTYIADDFDAELPDSFGWERNEISDRYSHFIWSFQASEWLSDSATSLLKDPNNEIFLSMGSIWGNPDQNRHQPIRVRSSAFGINRSRKTNQRSPTSAP